MRSVLRATLMLGASSIVSILVGLVSAKVMAVLVGPTGLGYMALLQSLLGLSALIAGLGVGAGLVRLGANPLARGDLRRVSALERAAWILFWVLGGVTLLLMTLFRGAISRWMLGDTTNSGIVILVGIALLFSLASSLQTSMLNVYHRVKALASFGITNSILGTSLTLILVWIWREQGITPAIVFGSVLGWLISSFYIRRNLREKRPKPTSAEVADAAQSLVRFGGPYAASMLVGTGVQFALPAVVLHILTTQEVGFYRAASSIAGVYLGFLLLAMGQDYYPRISAVSDKPAELIRLVNEQHRVVMLLSVPMILAVLALAPYVVPLVFSPEFRPAVEILEWQLIGDLFKFSSWTMGFVILARSSALTVFIVELIAGANILLTSWIGIHWFGLAGLGIGFLATYMVHYVVTWVVVRRSIGLTWSFDNKCMLLAASLASLVVRVLPFAGLESFRTPVALSLAVFAGIGSLYVIWKEVGGIPFGPFAKPPSEQPATVEEGP